MQRLFLAAAILVSITSCKKDIIGSGNIITQQRTTDNFNTIVTKGDFKVVVVKDQINSLEMTGEDNILEKVVTEVVGNQLTIKYENGVRIYRHKTVTVKVKTPSLVKTEIDGSGSIESADIWNATNFIAAIDGSGIINIHTISDSFDGHIRGSGDMNILGSEKAIQLRIDGSANIYAFGFIANDAAASINGSGKIETTATNNLEATIKGSGKIYYKGSPSISTNISGSGSVQKTK